VRYAIVGSPLGDIIISGHDSVVTGVDFTDARNPVRVQADWERNDGAFADAAEQLRAYFAGELTRFDLQLDLHGTTFQRRVWSALLDIPYGTTTSYGSLAEKLGDPRATRAVGLANGRNPISIIVPCHRVIGADGSLTGYGGGLSRKQWLLAHERGEVALAW
jgi:methylated-DNA-[protein]-cysteine S-methyltransferase